jgi:hypothetical protein
VALLAHGTDTIASGVATLATGQIQETLTAQGSEKIAGTLGAPPNVAKVAGIVADIVVPLGANALVAASLSVPTSASSTRGWLASRRPGSTSYTGVERFDELFKKSKYFKPFKEGLERQGFSVTHRTLPPDIRAEMRATEIVYDETKTTYLDMLHEARHVHQYLTAQRTNVLRGGDFFSDKFTPVLERGAYEYELRLGRAFEFQAGTGAASENRIAQEGWTLDYEHRFFSLPPRSVVRKLQRAVEPRLDRPRY